MMEMTEGRGRIIRMRNVDGRGGGKVLPCIIFVNMCRAGGLKARQFERIPFIIKSRYEGMMKEIGSTIFTRLGDAIVMKTFMMIPRRGTGSEGG